jgi:hypothetical protein
VALYIPVSRRRRNAFLLALATLLVGLVAGFLAGQSSAVTAEERSADVHARADTLGTRLQALTIEYEQAISGTGDTVQAGVLAALDAIDQDLERLIEDAPWIGATQIDSLHLATTGVRSAAERTATIDEFTAIVATAATTVRETFGTQSDQ